jgi:hypothetical protein
MFVPCRTVHGTPAITGVGSVETEYLQISGHEHTASSHTTVAALHEYQPHVKIVHGWCSCAQWGSARCKACGFAAMPCRYAHVSVLVLLAEVSDRIAATATTKCCRIQVDLLQSRNNCLARRSMVLGAPAKT